MGLLSQSEIIKCGPELKLVKVDDSTIQVEVLNTENVLVVVVYVLEFWQLVEINLVSRIVLKVGNVLLRVFLFQFEEISSYRSFFNLNTFNVWDQLDV